MGAVKAASEAVDRSIGLVTQEGLRGRSACAGALNTLGVAKKELAVQEMIRGETVQFEKYLREAIDTYDLAVTLTQGRLAVLLSKALTNRGWARATLGELDNAEDDLRIAIRLKKDNDDKPGLVAAYENLAGVVRQRGDEVEAEALIKAAMQLRSGGYYTGGKTWHQA